MYAETFPQRLVQARKKKYNTQEDAAAALNIPRSTLANYEIGRTEPDIETLCKMIDCYEAYTNEVLGTRK